MCWTWCNHSYSEWIANNQVRPSRTYRRGSDMPDMEYNMEMLQFYQDQFISSLFDEIERLVKYFKRFSESLYDLLFC